MRLISAVAHRLRHQHGFTTVTLMGAFAVGSLLVAGGFAAVQPDIQMSRASQDYKQAYGGADAGVQWYLSGLVRDNSFYTQCTEVPDPNDDEQAPVNPEWDGAGADPRVWRNLPGGDEAQYTVELLPAPGYEECDPDDQYSMIDSSGNMRLRVTGRSRGEARSIIVTLRRRNFIDFIYFTHFETLDPLAESSSSQRSWASTNCNQFREQRDAAAANPNSDRECTEIQFASGDVVSGPLHTNDSIWVCGGATFGRSGKDAIELNGEAPGYVQIGTCNPTPNMLGDLDHPSGQMALPPSNQELLDIVDPAYVFKGRTKIVFNGDTMTVRRKNASTEQTMPLPPNGLIYVKNDGNCSVAYYYEQTYQYEPNIDFVKNNTDTASSACGNAWVKGSYSSEVTIAADNDVIVYGNLERNEDNLLLGLIANNFVRVFHPCSSSQGNRTGSLSNPVIEAAILALNHSFIVDNWYCGDGLGTLTVEGAIAQRYRGPVGRGVGGSSAQNGYVKNYVYNDRLKFREPPYFLDPVQSAWRVARQNEQVPATK